MAKKKSKSKSSKANHETRTSFMFQNLHEAVLEAIPLHTISKKTHFHEFDNDKDAIERYSTHVMGRFVCTNYTTCHSVGWGSKKVAILIRRYAGNGYNAVVFNQRCEKCNQLGRLKLDETSYVERVAYRIQKWAGLRVERPVYSSKKGKPHKSELCEGCIRGVCRESDD